MLILILFSIFYLVCCFAGAVFHLAQLIKSVPNHFTYTGEFDCE